MFDFLFNPQGRVSRKGFAIGFFLPWLVLTVILPLVLPANAIVGLVTTLIGLFYLWPSFVAVPVKRWHDLGKTGWLQLVIPAIGIVGFVLMMIGMFQAYDGTPEAFGAEFEGITSNAGMYAVFWELIRPSPLAIFGTVLFFGYLIEFVVFCLIPGQQGPNEHGEDPHASGRGFAD